MIHIVILVLLSAAGGYALCRAFGPTINTEAGIIVHRGITYVEQGINAAVPSLLGKK